MPDISASVHGQKAPARAWAVLVATYLACFTAPLAQFKVPALADWIIPDLIVPFTGGDAVAINTYFGLLMTGVTIMAVILAFPSSWICNKLGLKKVMLGSIVFLFIGTAMGLSENFALFLGGRFVEGIGMGLVGVASPSCVALWFPPSSRGKAMAIWATWVPLAITIIFNIAPSMATAMGWRSVFFFCMALDVIGFALFAIVFKMPDGDMALEQEESSFKEGWKYLKNPKLWILAIIFFCFNVVQLGVVNNYYNQFLTSIGLSSQVANTMTTIPTVIGIFTAIAAGAIFDRLKFQNKHVLWIVVFAGSLIGYFFAFATGNNALGLIWFSVIFTGIFNGGGAGTLRSFAPLLVPRTALATTMAMALMQFSQQFAPAISSPIYGAVVGAIGWQNANYIVILPMLAIALILSIALGSKNLGKKQDKINDRFEAELEAVPTEEHSKAMA